MRIAVVFGACVLAAASVALAQSQSLPTQVIEVDRQSIVAEIADEAGERQIGLMNRRSMPEGHGMLFVFERAEPVAFWMRNTLIPLDMLFFGEDGVVHTVHSYVPPCTTPDCPLYPAEKPTKYVLELNAGEAASLSLGVGSTLVPPPPDS